MRIPETLCALLLVFSIVACDGGGSAVDVGPDAGARCPTCTYLDPWSSGPYPVGVRSDLWIDPSRTALTWTGCGQTTCPRPVPVSIWYPADDSARDLPPSSFDAFFSVTEAELQQVVDDLVEEFGSDQIDVTIPEFPVEGRRDAPLRAGRWPVVIFSHGAGGVRFQSVFLTEYLAAHGYVVVAPDHEGDATITEINGEIVTVDTRKFIESALKRPRDVQFLIDRLTELDRDSQSWLFGALAMELGVGLTGHSFGAYTSITVAGIDERIAAIVPQAAPGLSGFGEAVPTMFMIATEDDTIGAEGNDLMRAEYDMAPAPKMTVELLDAGHYTYSNMCDLFPDFGDGCGTGERITDGSPLTYVAPEDAFAVINGFTTAWFGAWIKGAQGYFEALQQRPLTDRVRYTTKASGVGL